MNIPLFLAAIDLGGLLPSLRNPALYCFLGVLFAVLVVTVFVLRHRIGDDECNIFHFDHACASHSAAVVPKQFGQQKRHLTAMI